MSLLPASKGEFNLLNNKVQQYEREIDQQNLVIKQLVKQVNALTPVSELAAL